MLFLRILGQQLFDRYMYLTSLLTLSLQGIVLHRYLCSRNLASLGHRRCHFLEIREGPYLM